VLDEKVYFGYSAGEEKRAKKVKFNHFQLK